MKNLNILLMALLLSGCGLVNPNSMAVSETLQCSSAGTLQTFDNKGWIYEVYTYSDGSMHIKCSVGGPIVWFETNKAEACSVNVPDTKDSYVFAITDAGGGVNERSLKFYQNGVEDTSKKIVIPDPKFTGTTSTNCARR